MSIIVDGYNYIGRSKEFELDDPIARDKLIYLLGQYCGKAQKALTIVFDGSYADHQVNRKRQYGSVTVIYTSPIYNADDAIKKMVKKQSPKHRKNMLVVSSDASVLDYAQSHGTSVSKSEDFERLVYDTIYAKQGVDRVNVRISPQEVEEWLKIFGPEHSQESAKATGKTPQKSFKTHASAKIESRSPLHLESSDARSIQDSKQQVTPKAPKRQPALPQEEEEDAIDRVNIHLSKEEVDEWLELFTKKSVKSKK